MPDGRVYLTTTAAGGLLADWRSDGERVTFSFSVNEKCEPLDEGEKPNE
jgi:hypothetical protein